MRKLNTDLPEFIFNSTITALIDEVSAFKEDVELTWDSFGGSTSAGQKWIDFLNDRENKTDARVAGIVASMGATALPFFSNVKGSIQSDVMLHRVAGGEVSTHQHTNEFFYKALSKKIDQDRFKEVTGYTLKEVFLPKDLSANRIEVWLTGKQAGYIGLYDETYDLLDKAATIKHKVNVDELDYDLPEHIQLKYGFKTKKNDMEIKDVTISGLKTGNVDVYNSIVDNAKKAEQNRVSAILKYAEHDMEKAREMIKSGAELTPEDVEHFLEKKYNKETVENLENNSEGKLNAARKPIVPEGQKTDEEKEKEEKKEALNEVGELVGLGKYLKEDK